MSDKFHYAIGRPWPKGVSNVEAAFYCHGNEIFYGTMQDAENQLAICNNERAENEGPYRIYKVVDLAALDDDEDYSTHIWC